MIVIIWNNVLKYSDILVFWITAKNSGPEQLSRYNDSLRAERSGDRIPVEARFSAIYKYI
jgi:hypothetical protein